MAARLVKGQNDIDAAKESASYGSKAQHELAKANKRIGELESLVEQRNNQNFDMSTQIKDISNQLQKLIASEKNFEKERRQMNQELQTSQQQSAALAVKTRVSSV